MLEGGALNKHRTPRGEILSGVGGLYAADHGADAAFRDPRKVQLLDGDPAGKEALDHHAAGQAPMIPPKYLHKNKAPDTFKVIQCLIPLIQPAGNRIWAAANAARQHLPAIPLPYPSYSR